MSKRILIVGTGVIGLCTAYYAMKRGHRVTLMDRAPADHSGCSTGNAGMIVPSHFIPLAAPGMVGLGLRMMFNQESPFSLRPRASTDLLEWVWKFFQACTPNHVLRSAPLLRDLGLASRSCFEEIAGDASATFTFEKRGLLMLCKTASTLRHESATAIQAHKLGMPAEILSPEEAARLNPGLQMRVAGAVYFPLDGHLCPEQFLRSLTRTLQRAGVEFLWETEAESWIHQGRRLTAVQTQRGVKQADEFVIAAGAWSHTLVRELGLHLPMQAGKGYSITLPAPRQIPCVPSILTEARVAVTPMGSRLRFGGTMEIAGHDPSVNHSRVRGMIRSIPDYFPGFTEADFRNQPVWSGLRPCSPDGLPYVGRAGIFENLSIAAGHAMLGLSLGPVTGRLVTELISGETPSISLDPLSPNRHARS